jgi:replicative DNA helicase
VTAHVSSERLIIGALLRQPDLIWQLREKLKPNMLSDSLCRTAYETVIALTDEQKKPTLPLIKARIDGEDAGSMLAALRGRLGDRHCG